MSRKILQRLCLTVLALSAARLAAQQPVLSPQATAEIALDGKRLAIEYGQPSIRGRKIMGDVVPYNKVWRTGTGKATTLVSTADFQLGDVEIPRGTYTLYTFPSAAQWKLIVNKQTGQWGTTYNADLDFARINLNVQTLRTPLENLTFRLERMQNNSGVLKIEWERTSLSVPFKFLQDAFVASPRDSTEVILQGKRVVVNYSRPSRRGRTIMGAVVPYGEVWRTGANEATAFVTDVDLFVGDAEVPRGAYTLYTLPSQNVWKLIINKETGQWGTKYD
ncbi:MAG: DUF2911 domain-containing protein, partial [Bacteroidota bacterium]